jgi:hypothetical protein
MKTKSTAEHHDDAQQFMFTVHFPDLRLRCNDLELRFNALVERRTIIEQTTI